MTRHEILPRAAPGPRLGGMYGEAFGEVLLVWLMLVLSATSAVAGAQSVTLTYLNAPAEHEPILHPPTLGVAVGSGDIHRAVMDTGSTGVVISASSIRNLDELPVLGEGTLTYSSSGRVMQGKYVRTAVTIIGGNGATVTTRPIPVLAVQRVDCLATARHCQPQTDPRGIAMLGVGFARERDFQREGTPDKNPFLNLPEMGQPDRPGALGRGYVIGRRQVQVGLHPGPELSDFTRIQLSPSKVAGDWNAPETCISVSRRTPHVCGTLLVDTGVTTMYLSVPEAQSEGLEQTDARGEPVLADGAEVAVLPSPGNTAPAYRFMVGNAEDALAPTQVVLVGNGRRPPFVNTTVRLLNGYDYAYDADAGMVGFRPVHQPRDRH